MTEGLDRTPWETQYPPRTGTGDNTSW